LLGGKRFTGWLGKKGFITEVTEAGKRRAQRRKKITQSRRGRRDSQRRERITTQVARVSRENGEARANDRLADRQAGRLADGAI
jgi:hypothetical protein